MDQKKIKLSVRSVSEQSYRRLGALKRYSRLTYGSLVDDAIEALWEAYLDDGHPLPDVSNFGEILGGFDQREHQSVSL